MYVYIHKCVCMCITCIYVVLSYVGGNKESIYLCSSVSNVSINKLLNVKFNYINKTSQVNKKYGSLLRKEGPVTATQTKHAVK